MYLNKTYNKVCMGRSLSDAFPIQNGLKQGDALLPLLFNYNCETLEILLDNFNVVGICTSVNVHRFEALNCITINLWFSLVSYIDVSI
jgi:hypothetical protein